MQPIDFDPNSTNETQSHPQNPPNRNKNRPFFLWRGWPCVDGSILAGRKDVPPHLREHEHVTFDYVEDEALRCVCLYVLVCLCVYEK